MEERHCVAHSGVHIAEVFGGSGLVRGLEGAGVVVSLSSF